MKPTSEIYGEQRYITTYTGKQFSLDNPEFDIKDIAHAASMLCRYNGHSRHFYSVAEHSVLVSLLMEELGLGDPLEGLMHDATEAYLSDIPAPFKQSLPELGALDDRLEYECRIHFGLPTTKTPGCKKADWLALFIEGFYLMPHKGEGFIDPDGHRPEALKLVNQGWRVNGLEPTRGEAMFLNRFEELTNEKKT